METQLTFPARSSFEGTLGAAADNAAFCLLGENKYLLLRPRRFLGSCDTEPCSAPGTRP